jgi:acyl dehydratase
MAIERFPIEAGHVMMFARAIGDPNPVYADEEVAGRSEVGAIPAPPTFVTASAQFDPDYPLRPKPGEPWFGSGRDATGAAPSVPSGGSGGGGTSLHAEQHYEYHRPLRPGDVLTATTSPGKSWTREGRRGGTMQFRESVTEWRDEAGELVLTTRSVGVTTGKVVTSEGGDK